MLSFPTLLLKGLGEEIKHMETLGWGCLLAKPLRKRRSKINI